MDLRHRRNKLQSVNRDAEPGLCVCMKAWSMRRKRKVSNEENKIYDELPEVQFFAEVRPAPLICETHLGEAQVHVSGETRAQGNKKSVQDLPPAEKTADAKGPRAPERLRPFIDGCQEYFLLELLVRAFLILRVPYSLPIYRALFSP